jgi:hypothetical protein
MKKNSVFDRDIHLGKVSGHAFGWSVVAFNASISGLIIVHN